jgi:hypothetical protein
LVYVKNPLHAAEYCRYLVQLIQYRVCNLSQLGCGLGCCVSVMVSC